MANGRTLGESKKPRYKFRKMYFICENKRVISPNVGRTNAYQFKETADSVLESQKRSFQYLWENSNPTKVNSVEGFYLVPEALYEEVLKKWMED